MARKKSKKKRDADDFGGETPNQKMALKQARDNDEVYKFW